MFVFKFFPAEKSEIDKFKDIVVNRKVSQYYPSFKAAERVGISGRALGKITSNFMVITSDNQKTNLGLCLKFEAKALKVIDYSRKDGRNWDYSDKAVELLKEYKASYFFKNNNTIVPDICVNLPLFCRANSRSFSVVLIVMGMVCDLVDFYQC